jgi:ribonuclease HII
MQKLQKKTFKYIIGIDEVGRGPVAGPVAVCVSLMEYGQERRYSKRLKSHFKSAHLPPLRDSKKLTEKGREVWFESIRNNIHFELGYSSAKQIDKKGIAVCIKSLIQKNILNLQKKIGFTPGEVLILLDGGLKASKEYINQETIIKGDDKEPIISFASIFAKVNRDRLMVRLAKQFPNYGFEKHKGYGTKMHMEAIRRHKISKHHRKTFLRSTLATKPKQG